MGVERVSVRDLVSFNLSNGSLGSGIVTSTRANIGTKIHQEIQSSRDNNYKKEYSLKNLVEHQGVSLEVYGRADGIYIDSKFPVVEEIKSTTSSNVSESHLAQVRIYAYLYLIESRLEGVIFDSIGIKLLYVDINSKKESIFEEKLSKSKLEDFFYSFITNYVEYLNNKRVWVKKRDRSLKDLKFPFKEFRGGQREFSVEVYRAIRDKETLIARAPTGTGKSIASLFPALKSMGEGFCSKIFYLTAKTVGRLTARDTLNIVRRSGCKIKSVVITAKEKICINSEYNCSPELCPYAKNYYDKLEEHLEKILMEDDFYEENLKVLGSSYSMCPFELSLDIATHCDVIICDYNYVFDLRVQLKRFFERSHNDYILLIDEAHNLPDRLRSSYSCALIREDIPPVVEIVKSISVSVMDILNDINNMFIHYSREYKKEFNIFSDIPVELPKILRSFTVLSEREIIPKEFRGKALFLDFYYQVLFFIKLSELYSEGHRFIIENRGGLGVTLKIECIDPSFLFTKTLLKSQSHILFSATLNPLIYYTTLLLDNREYRSINIQSPYNIDNLKLIIRSDIKTTYRERSRYYYEVAQTIQSVIKCKKGNYMVFFPSYLYLNEIVKLIDTPIHIQTQSMGEEQRINFINKFNSSESILCFAITGGIFSEGIDLVGEKLIGVIVVGVGLPQLSNSNNLIKDYFSKKNLNGYNYSYSYPGFNRVMQAVGRVIRREEDRGVAVLIDNRFNTSNYRRLFPGEWRESVVSDSRDDMINHLDLFWKE